MKILVLITNNKEITDNISLSRSDNLGIILLKKKDHVIYYLEEHIRDFIIFDSEEKTANLDALAEREILITLQGLMAGRTSLLITHRLLGLEAAGEILVLHDGQVVERGRHHELMQMDGLYSRMWELQNQIV